MEFTNKTITAVLLLATLTVLAHWNIWDDGVYALGWNTSAFWLSTLFLLWKNSPQRDFSRDKYWLLPLIGIALSYTIFENPWLKLISCFVLPIATGVFYAYGQVVNAPQQFWGLGLLKALVKRTATPLKFLAPATGFVKSRVAVVFDKQDSQLSRRIVHGVVLLIPIAATVLVLLASADENFAKLIDGFAGTLFELINWSIFAKLFFILVVAVLLFATLHAWSAPLVHDKPKQTITIDGVVAGIVMGGVLLIYLLFLWLQLDHLMIEVLPSSFAQVEHLVKSGFWQLFFLSILNAGLFFVVYKNTGAVAQIILRVFIVASGLLLLSAAWRMGLYVYWYGLSYEKFFASYTTLFALIVFVYLLLASLSSTRKDVLKFIAFSALWFYSVATLMPVEKIIFHSNVNLAQLEESNVRLEYLRDLSLDVVGDVEREFIHKPQPKLQRDAGFNWVSWVAHQRRNYCDRAWYEWRFSLMGNCSS